MKAFPIGKVGERENSTCTPGNGGDERNVDLDPITDHHYIF